MDDDVIHPVIEISKNAVKWICYENADSNFKPAISVYGFMKSRKFLIIIYCGGVQ